MGERINKNSKPSRAQGAEVKAAKPGLLVVLSAPSGGGKSTICKRLLRKELDFTYSVSVTTRPPRRGEKDGEHYKFISHKQFGRLIAADRLAEYATVHGHLYGTPKKTLRDSIAKKRVVLFDLDVVGGLALKRRYPQAVLIFLVPPSWEVLKSRLAGRRTEAPADLRRRLSRAQRELPFWRSYDYVVINDLISDSVADCLAIIRAERLRTVRAPRFRGRRAAAIAKLEV